MDNGIIQHIANLFKRLNSGVLLVENNDKFLYREDVIKGLRLKGVEIETGTALQQRVIYELRDKESLLILLSQNNKDTLEDIKQNSQSFDFFFENLFEGYHIPSIIALDISILDQLFKENQFFNLNKQETLRKVESLKSTLALKKEVAFDFEEFVLLLENQLNTGQVNWSKICRIISEAILHTIGTDKFEDVLLLVNKANDIFQENVKTNYQQTKSSAAIKKPKIVSKILDFLSFNFQNDKVALIVVDGMAFWQYELLKKVLPEVISEDVIYSWIPSITQLSRQAIFRGNIPQNDYKQGPINEEKLWKSYWTNTGIEEYKIRYNHETIDLDNIINISKFAIVFKDLDEKMHSSSDYKDLLSLTENWIARSEIGKVIHELKEAQFKIFLTTDHGNIQAKGWRGLKGKEKLGTNKSGSRSLRHIEYSDTWLKDDFMLNNPDLKDFLLSEDQAVYFKNDLSFSQKQSLVTHGGAHLLEVLIPFVEI